VCFFKKLELFGHIRKRGTVRKYILSSSLKEREIMTLLKLSIIWSIAFALTSNIASEANNEVVELAEESVKTQVIITEDASLLEYGDFSGYLSKGLEEYSSEKVISYVYELEKQMENVIIEYLPEYETDKYIFFFATEVEQTCVENSFVLCWEKSNPRGGVVLDAWICDIEGFIDNRYLVTDCGTYIDRLLTFCDMERGLYDERLYQYAVVVGGMHRVEGTDWFIYAAPTNATVEGFPYDMVYDVVFRNLNTQEEIIYKEASGRVAWDVGMKNGEFTIYKWTSVGEYDYESTFYETLDLSIFKGDSVEIKSKSKS